MKGVLSLKCILPLLLITFCKNIDSGNKIKSFSSGQLQAVVDEYMKDKRKVLGTIIKVDIRGKQSYEAASGYFDISRKTPVRPDDQFIIGSITKVFTAVLVLQLVETGKADLQRPIIDYMPSDWAAVLRDIKYGGEITVEHALSHRSGIAEVTGTEAFLRSLILDPSRSWTPLEVLKLSAQKGEPEFMPGKGYDYCNSNYLLLGALIENVTKQSFGMSLKENIFTRIGLDNTFLSESTFGSGREGIAHGYYRLEERLIDGQEVNVGWAQASGGIISNADDLIKFYGALVSQKLFERKKTYRQMIELVGENESYGRGLMIFEDPEIGSYYGHPGNFCNTRSILAYFPEHRMTIVVSQTYYDFSMSEPSSLMKAVVQKMMHHESAGNNGAVFEGNDLLADTSSVFENEDTPALGNWDFDLKELWRVGKVDARSITDRFHVEVGSDGETYMLDPEAAEIFTLNPDGSLLFSSGGEEVQIDYAAGMYITSDHIHVFDMGNTGSKIHVFNKKGNFEKSFKLDVEISPRIFISGEEYVALRSGPDVRNKEDYEKLEILNLKSKQGSVIGKIAAEERLIVSTRAVMGRVHLLLDDIELFPRLIVHINENMLYLGRSDRYLIKKVDLKGNEALAFGIRGRARKSLPELYKEARIAGTGRVGGKEMPQEMKEQLLAGIPDSHVFFINMTTDEQGLIYVFVPDVGDKRKQEIDIFSPEGKYLYRSVIELPDAIEKTGPFVLSGECLTVLVKDGDGVNKLIKYRIRKPVF